MRGLADVACRRRLGAGGRRRWTLGLLLVALALAVVPASALGTNRVVDWGLNGSNSLDVGWDGSNEPSPQLARGASDATQVTGGWHTNYAVMPDETVKAWGGNAYAQLGDGT